MENAATMNAKNIPIEVKYVDRVKHVMSQHRTCDDELEYAQTISEPADTIEIVTKDDETQVTVSTEQGVYHFTMFRANYVGHASRALIRLLEHFRIRLPIEFVTAHQTFRIFIKGRKIVTSEDKEYPIAERSGVYELVEPVEWMISSAVLDSLYQLSQRFDVSPVELAESAVGTLHTLLTVAEDYQVTPDEIISTLIRLIQQQNEVTDDAPKDSDSTLAPESLDPVSELQ